MSLDIRHATPMDVPDLMRVRTSVRENILTKAQLEALGITEDSLRTMLESDARAWCAESDGRVVGFSMARQSHGEIFALFVHPDFEHRGCGSTLLAAAVAWLASVGRQRAVLGTDPASRALSFYLKRGWRRVGKAPNGDVQLELTLARGAADYRHGHSA